MARTEQEYAAERYDWNAPVQSAAERREGADAQRLERAEGEELVRVLTKLEDFMVKNWHGRFPLRAAQKLLSFVKDELAKPHSIILKE